VFPEAAATSNHSEYLGKLDYNIGSRDTLSATFAAQDTPNTVPFSGSSGATTVNGFPISDDTAAYFGNVGYTTASRPPPSTWPGSRRSATTPSRTIPSARNPVRRNWGSISPRTWWTGPPIINLEGSGLFAGYNPFGPADIVDNTLTFTDDFSWTRGSHSLKGGFLFSAYRDAMIYGYYLNGEFDFYGPGRWFGSGNDLADFLMGLPDDFPGVSQRAHQHPLAFLRRIRAGRLESHRRFTLNYGLRYEYNQPKYDTQGRSFSFIPGLQSTVFPGAPLGLLFPGDKGAPRGANWPDRTNFAPRLGFAWDVFGNAKTSVRGGAGMFYDILKAEDNLQFNGQAPFFGPAY
jgi:hypothetical protein